MTISLGGCSGPGNDGAGQAAADDALTCAALIGAADRLMNAGVIARSPSLAEKGLVAAMTYLNRHAIPKGIEEREAFNQVNAERDRLIAALPASDIAARAEACIQRVPKA